MDQSRTLDPMPETMIKLFCWIFGDRELFAVKISPDETVFDLKEAIVTKKPNRLQGIDADSLRLWKKEVTEEEKDGLQLSDLNDGDELRATLDIGDYFEEAPPKRKIHIIVKIPETKDSRGPKRRRSEKKNGFQIVDDLVAKGAPSSFAASPNFRKVTGPGLTIGYNRPFERNTIPLPLLHEAFGVFCERRTDSPSAEAQLLLDELTEVCCGWYTSEPERQVAVLDVLETHASLPFTPQVITLKDGRECRTDGNLPVRIMPAAIRECKDQTGCALNQAILYYSRFLHNALQSPYSNHASPFPSILLVDIGSCLGFYGCVWDGTRIRVDPLTPMFDLTVHSRDSVLRRDIASSLDAFMLSVNSIENFYLSIKAPGARVNSISDADQERAKAFPYVTTYEDARNKVAFSYDKRLDDNKLLFLATANQFQFLVKFTPKYSEDCHRYLESRGRAPKLLNCRPLRGGWKAVFMEISRYKPLYGMNLTDEEKNKVREKVMKVVMDLHEGGFVHGDIRDTNILVDLDSLTDDSDGVNVQLIDFDWAGSVGAARYPLGVNKTTVWRPDGVQDEGLITVEHDKEMVSSLFQNTLPIF